MRFEFIEDEAFICQLIRHRNEVGYCVLDLETTSKDPHKAELIHVQMSGLESDHAVAFSGKFLSLLKELTCTLVLHNFKYDFKVAHRHGVDLRGHKVIDTMLLDHLADENRLHSLDSYVQRVYQDDYKEKFWSRYESYQSAPLAEQVEYGCKDIYYTDRLYLDSLVSIHEQGIPDSLILHVHRLAMALFDTELLGIKVDLPHAVELGSALKKDILDAEVVLNEEAGAWKEVVELELWSKAIKKAWKPAGKKWLQLPKPDFNWASSGQVAALLYDKLGLPPVINRKTRKRTVDDKALEKLEHLNPLIPKLRLLRKYQTMFGTFIEGILDRAEDERIYPSLNINGTVTGRISHSDPNLGNMPSKGEWTKIRGIFRPDDGYKILTADYSQLEVCIAAHFSLDPNLLKIIREGASKHDITAEGVGLPRSTAKTLNFAMQYLCSPHKVSEIIAGTKEEGQEVWDKYWATYAGEKKVVDECKALIDKGLPIVSPYGRMRRFPTQFESKGQREAAYRQAYSSKIQGLGADLTSEAFYLADEEFKLRKWGRCLFTVHDELVTAVKHEHTADAGALMSKIMVYVGEQIKLNVPLKAELSDPTDRWCKS